MADDRPLTCEDIPWTLNPLLTLDPSGTDGHTEIALLVADVVQLENEVRIYRELLQTSMTLTRELTVHNERLTDTLRTLHDRLPSLASR